jgi:tetratricopeptide (TPR) repeat protein
VQRALSITYYKMGDVLTMGGDREQALAAYQKSLAIAEQLAGSDKGNAEWQRDLSISLERYGNALFAAGKSEQALAAFQKALPIAQQLRQRQGQRAMAA